MPNQFDIESLRKAASGIDKQMFDRMYQPQWPESRTPFKPNTVEYAPTKGEVACLESFALQEFDVEDDPFHIELVYPERIPLEYYARGRGIRPQDRDGVALFVYSVVVNGKEVGVIQTEVGLWAQQYRLKLLWSGHYDNARDPADVMSDGPEKWVTVHEQRTKGGRDYNYTRGKPTTYNRAGGKRHDPKQQGVGGVHHSDMEWITETTAQMYAPPVSWHNQSDPVARAAVDYIHHETRRTLDRAHADEMFGPSDSDAARSRVEVVV